MNYKPLMKNKNDKDVSVVEALERLYTLEQMILSGRLRAVTTKVNKKLITPDILQFNDVADGLKDYTKNNIRDSFSPEIDIKFSETSSKEVEGAVEISGYAEFPRPVTEEDVNKAAEIFLMRI